MKKSGFTLMELMVYIAIMGIVVLVAGQAFSDSTKMRVRTQSMITANQVAENVASLLKDDIAQMGAKSASDIGNSTAGNDAFVFKNSVYMSLDETNPDSSSFTLTKNKNGTKLDEIVLRRILYTAQGEFVRVEEITWVANNGKLYRSCQTIDGTDDDDCKANEPVSVEMASGVESFEVIPAKPGVLATATNTAEENARILPSTDPTVTAFRLVSRYGEQDFYYTTTNPENGGQSVTMSGFASNYDFERSEPILDGKKANQLFVAEANGNIGDWKSLCTKIDLQAATEYEISFIVPYVDNNSRMFCPGRDHATVGFRNADGTKVDGIDDFGFFLPISATEPPKRTMRFSVNEDVEDVCMAFTFASYSPVVASGSVTIQNLVLKKVESANYDFSNTAYSPELADKKNIKAMRVQLVVKNRNEAGSVSFDIPISSNGPRG